MTKPTAFIAPPFYDIKSDALKTILNASDDRTIVKRLQDAGVHIRRFGNQRVVLFDDLIAAAMPEEADRIAKYRPKTELSRSLSDLDHDFT